MLAPTDAKVSVKVGGENIVLRLNWRSISLAESEGIDLLTAEQPEMLKADSLKLVKCLALEEQPYFTEDHVLTMAVSAPDALQSALIELFAQFGGKVAPGNLNGRKPRRSA